MSAERFRSADELENQRRPGPAYRAIAYAHGSYHDMDRPELQWLRYDVTVNGALPTAESLRPDMFALADFRCHFAENQLWAVPIRPMSDWNQAADMLRRPLANWESYSELRGLGRLRFTLRHFAFVDRPETTSPSSVCIATLGDLTWVTEADGPANTSELPPLPPPQWATDSLVEVLRLRWRDALERRSSPLVEGQFALSAIESRFGGRKAACQALNINSDVLHLLGAICVADDPLQGRKFGKEASSNGRRGRVGPMTHDEGQWIVALLQAIAGRLADAEWCKRPLTLRDLPRVG